MPNKVFYEGGDDFKDADVDAPPKSKNDKKKDKYGGDMDDFSISKNSKITDGIVKERGCTDVICLGVFIVFLVGMFSITSYAFAEGDVTKYLAPVDGNGQICGYGKMEGKTYLEFADYSSLWDDAVCVAKCPTGTHSVAKYCAPVMSGKKETTETKEFAAGFKTMLESNAAGKQLLDLYKSSTAIFISIAMAIILCFAFIYLMSYFAEQIAWTIVGIAQIAFFVGSAVCIFEYFNVKNSGNVLKKDSATSFLVGGIVLGLFGILFLIALVCGFHQLKIAIDVIDASADFLRKTKRIILVPVVYFFLQVIVVMTWMFAMCCIWSTGDITASDGINPSH